MQKTQYINYNYMIRILYFTLMPLACSATSGYAKTDHQTEAPRKNILNWFSLYNIDKIFDRFKEVLK